ncbi:hypothetical protein FOCC_FOCC006307 [Frankliniella occidentalis]|nr:hypothetical protein FOCC_FOCC006307 [Frankliniella occidentalis]
MLRRVRARRGADPARAPGGGGGRAGRARAQRGRHLPGLIFFNVFKWRMAANLTNLLEFDAMALGNHEFDEGVAGLLPFLREVRAPAVAANLDLGDAPELRPLVRPSIVLDVRGTRVAVIGYVTPDTATLAKPEQVRFTDEIPTLTAEAERLHGEGVRIIIALGHSGYPMDKEIAAKVPHVDLVVGGHSHSFLYTGAKPDIDEPVGLYPTFVRQPSGREVPVVQAYAYTKYLGRIKIRFDADGEIAPRGATRGGRLEESAGRRRYHPHRQDSHLPRRQVQVQGVQFGQPRRRLLRKLPQQYQGPGWTDAAIGVQNGGNIRTSINNEGNGTLTLQNMMEACPFENFLVVLYLPGSVLLQMLEHSVYGYDPTGQFERGGFLQYSGIRVTYDLTAPYGQRVVAASARCANCSIPSYSPVDEKAIYGVITTDFTANGGDGFSMLTTAPSAHLADITPYTAMAEYIRVQSVVYPGLEGRIKFAPRRTASGALAIHGDKTPFECLALAILVSFMSVRLW